MVTREQALEWAKEAGGDAAYYGADMTEGMRFYDLGSVEFLVRRAYAEGQRAMRERAAVASEKTVCVTVSGIEIFSVPAAKKIRALEIEE